MTGTITSEFPTLDLTELDDVPGRRVRHIPAVEHTELPAILAAWLPTVVHARRRRAKYCDVHEFIDAATGDSVRCVLTLDWCGDTCADIAETGQSSLWQRITAACDAWERAGRTIPAVTAPRGQTPQA